MSDSTVLQTVPTTDGHLAYREQGSGRPVVLIHGGALDHRMWDPQVEALSRRYRVIAPDARGHGRSSTPTAPYRHADDLVALLRHLGISRATLVGLSSGAWTAVDTAVEYPEFVEALVISGAGTGDPDFRDPWVLQILQTWSRTQQAKDMPGWLDAFMLFLAGPHRDLSDLDPDLVHRVRSIATDTFTTHVLDGEPVLPSPVSDVRARARTIAVPVLAVVGGIDSDDHIRMATEIADSVPRGTAHTIDGTAHYPNLEKPDEFNEALEKFLRVTA
jgi:pimeloyl-ACP methyl ester carboxylesterase